MGCGEIHRDGGEFCQKNCEEPPKSYFDCWVVLQIVYNPYNGYNSYWGISAKTNFTKSPHLLAMAMRIIASRLVPMSACHMSGTHATCRAGMCQSARAPLLGHSPNRANVSGLARHNSGKPCRATCPVRVSTSGPSATSIQNQLHMWCIQTN